MENIKTKEDLRSAINRERSVVIFGEGDCIHCTIVKNCIESIEKEYPLVGFHYTEEKAFSTERNMFTHPVIVFYENGAEQGRMIGSNHITIIRDILNLWFKKD